MQEQVALCYTDDVLTTSHCSCDVRGRRLCIIEICWSALKHHLGIDLLDDLERVKVSATFLIGAYSSFGFLCLKKPLEIEAAWRYSRAIVIDTGYYAWLDAMLTVQIRRPREQ